MKFSSIISLSITLFILVFSPQSLVGHGFPASTQVKLRDWHESIETICTFVSRYRNKIISYDLDHKKTCKAKMLRQIAQTLGQQ